MPRDKSPLLTALIIGTIGSGNYFFGYFIGIMNIVADPLLKQLYQKNEDDFKTFSGYFGFFFSIGCFLGLISQNALLRTFGKIRLAILVELCNITVAILYTVESLGLLLALRVVSGFIGGLSLAFLAVLCVDMFVSTKANIATASTALWSVIFFMLASLQEKFFGGNQGILKNWKIIFWWPAVFGGIRLALILLIFGVVETPDRYLETLSLDSPELKPLLSKYYHILYVPADAERMVAVKLESHAKLTTDLKKGANIRQMLSRKYLRRFVLCLINQNF